MLTSQQAKLPFDSPRYNYVAYSELRWLQGNLEIFQKVNIFELEQVPTFYLKVNEFTAAGFKWTRSEVATLGEFIKITPTEKLVEFPTIEKRGGAPASR